MMTATVKELQESAFSVVFLKGNLPAVLDKASPSLALDISYNNRSMLRPQKSVDHQIAGTGFLQ